MEDWKMKKLTDAERDIMQVLWEAGEPMRAGDIVHSLDGSRSWKTQTAHVLLNRLCEKGYVAADREGYYHRFYPLVSEREYADAASASLVKQMGRSVRAVVASLIDTDSLSEEDIDNLSRLLAEKRAALQDGRKENTDADA